MKCDVLVVGAGPAGSSTAMITAKRGLKTVLIEEHKEVGKPVQCAEGIGSYLFSYLPFKIPKKQLKWRIDGMYFWADGISIIKKGGIWSGFSINRTDWDQWLVSMAIKEGVTLLTETKLISLELDGYNVKRAIAQKNGKEIVFEPKYLVAADGVNSTVIDCLGVRKRRNIIGKVKCYEMRNLRLKYPNYEQFFFGDFAPGAYAYIFPISRTRANIGVGALYKKDKLDEFFENFLDIPFVKKQISKGSIVTEKSGEAPVDYITEKWKYGNVFLVGDAANQNIKPFIEGILPGMICGHLLGKFIYNIFRRKNILENYENVINKNFNHIIISQRYIDFVFCRKKNNKIYNLILLLFMSGIISIENVDSYLKKDYNYLRDYILKNGGFIEL